MFPVEPTQGALSPEIGPGVDGATPAGVTTKVVAGLVPQALEAVTETVPELPLVVTVMAVVPRPEFITQPAGKVQL